VIDRNKTKIYIHDCEDESISMIPRAVDSGEKDRYGGTFLY
jgi:hypothetical protein